MGNVERFFGERGQNRELSSKEERWRVVEETEKEAREEAEQSGIHTSDVPPIITVTASAHDVGAGNRWLRLLKNRNSLSWEQCDGNWCPKN